MSTITTSDGTDIYYQDWGSGPVVTFSHGWPLSADAWDAQLHFPANNGFRVVAHDRSGHGRSSQPSSGNDMDGYADDLAAVIEALDLRDATLVGHSTGGDLRAGLAKDRSQFCKEIYYPGAPHGLMDTHQDQFNADLLAFLRS